MHYHRKIDIVKNPEESDEIRILLGLSLNLKKDYRFAFQ